MSEIKLQFDPNQRHQAEAVDAVVSLFDGQARREVSLSPIRGGGGADLWAGSGIDQAAGNDPYLLGGALKENLRAVQERYEVDVVNTNAEIEEYSCVGGRTRAYIHTASAPPPSGPECT